MPGCDVGEICDEVSGQCELVTEEGFVNIEGGTFEMGSPEDEAGRRSGEVQHTVTLSRGFAMMSTEVTQGRFEDLMGYNPSSIITCGLDCPVEMVNWYEAAAYCNALSLAAGYAACYSCTGTGVDVICEPAVAYATPYDCPGYRLPTEAEWEYAARAGTSSATYIGDLDDAHLECEQPNDALDSIAWFCGNSGETIHAVGTRDPNDWYLYDMLGNVWEWCHDWHGDYPSESIVDPWGSTTSFSHMVRGGSWHINAWRVRVAFRSSFSSIGRYSTFGFRVVRSSP